MDNNKNTLIRPFKMKIPPLHRNFTLSLNHSRPDLGRKEKINSKVNCEICPKVNNKNNRTTF